MLPFHSATLRMMTVAAIEIGPPAMYFALPMPVVATMVAAALVGIGVLVRGRPALAGTTLVAPWWWSTLVLLTVTALEVLVAITVSVETTGTNAGAAVPVWTTHVELVAAALTFCPLMALLGAKRPQDRAWQFIVLSLAIVLLLPAAEAVLFRPGAPLAMHAARRWFLVILLAVTLVTGLPTRRWLATSLLVAGQVLLLGEHVPGLTGVTAALGQWRAPIGMTLIALALLAAAHPWPRQPIGLAPWDRTWLDFRDAFGTLWGLRVIERFNDTARRSDWPVRLRWGGYEFEVNTPLSPRGRGIGSEGATIEMAPPGLTAAMRAAMASLLWRFVSDDWMARRWPAGEIA